ncbi:unnamed protein product [Hermetia illucens]|uniref:Uncharacterized protein n=1 Tax=Hermetia illucens TaxID=343691 RepID=A0A7R8YZU5_HERIL|nr:unnamed protein product [Hermetia illucens]
MSGRNSAVSEETAGNVSSDGEYLNECIGGDFSNCDDYGVDIRQLGGSEYDMEAEGPSLEDPYEFKKWPLLVKRPNNYWRHNVFNIKYGPTSNNMDNMGDG